MSKILCLFKLCSFAMCLIILCPSLPSLSDTCSIRHSVNRKISSCPISNVRNRKDPNAHTHTLNLSLLLIPLLLIETAISGSFLLLLCSIYYSLSFPTLSSSFFLFSILILSSALSLLAFGLLATNDISYFLLISLHPYSLRPLHSFLLLLCLFLSRFSYLYFLFNTYLYSFLYLSSSLLSPLFTFPLYFFHLFYSFHLFLTLFFPLSLALLNFHSLLFIHFIL